MFSVSTIVPQVNFLKWITILLQLSLLRLTYCDYDDSSLPINTTFLHNTFKNLIEPETSIAIILDDQETTLEPAALRPVLSSLHNSGTVIFAYKPDLKEAEIKAGTSGSVNTVNFIWTFVCLIEEKKSKQNAANYLNTILKIGHGRLDQFILLGFSNNLAPFFRVSVTKFKNIVAVAIGQQQQKNAVYQRTTGSKKLVKLTSSEEQNLSWLEIKTMIGLSGRHFRISGTKFPPYLDIFYDPEDNDNSSVEGKTLMGVNYQIFDQGSMAYNYTYEFNPPNDWKQLGTRLPNGTVTSGGGKI